MKDFIEFIRKQGVVGLAIGFILGGAVSKVVSALVEDLLNPLVGVVLGGASGLAESSFRIGSVEFMLGHFVSVIVDFIMVAAVVYFIFKRLGLEKLDKKA